MNIKSNLLMTTAVGAILAVWSGTVQSADLMPYKASGMPIEYHPWYIQVEGGVSVFDPHDATAGVIYNNICGPNNNNKGPCSFTSSLFGQAGPNVGIRLGYQINPIFRADVSFQYTSVTLTGLYTGSGTGPFCNGNFAGGCTLNATRSATALVGLVNGYIDLDPLWGMRFGRFHPYLTAGVGAASDHLGANCVSCDFGVGNGANTTTQFAWAAGAGGRIDLFSDLKFDVAYRYLDLGTFRGGFNQVANPQAKTGGDTVRMNAHTVTFGLTLLY